MINKRMIWILVLFLLIIPILKASVDVEYIYKINEDVDIKVACFDTNNALCDITTSCYITINDPDSTNIVKNGTMTLSDSYYNYTIAGILLNKKGEYSTTVNCEGTYNGYTTFLFGITSSGERTGGSGAAGIGVLIFVILITAGIFSLSRFKLSKDKVLNHVLRGGCILMGLYLLSLDMTIAVTIADNFTLGINQELFRFLWLINWTVYITMFIVVFKYFLETLKLWTAKKTLRRMGLDKLDK